MIPTEELPAGSHLEAMVLSVPDSDGEDKLTEIPLGQGSSSDDVMLDMKESFAFGTSVAADDANTEEFSAKTFQAGGSAPQGSCAEDNIGTVAPHALCALQAPTCGRCGSEVDVFRAQLKSKYKGTYVCNQCNTKQKMLSTMFKFPTDDFRLLPEEDKRQSG